MAAAARLHYQRRRAATIWSVFGKMTYERAYYAVLSVWQRTSRLSINVIAHTNRAGHGRLWHSLLALSGIDKSFEKKVQEVAESLFVV